MPFSETGLKGVSLSEKRMALVDNKGSSGESNQIALKAINADLTLKREELNQAYSIANKHFITLINAKASQEVLNEETQKQLEIIKPLQESISLLEEQWKKTSEESLDQDFDALWHQPDTTIGQLVIDYGSSNFVYVMPPEISSLKIHISSQLSVPRALWGEMLEQVLAGYGIGIKQVSPFLRQLSFLRINPSGLSTITDSKEELLLMSDEEKVAFLLTPEPSDVRRVVQFLERFAPQEQISISQAGGSVLIVGYVREINELLKIAGFITSPKLTNTWRLVTLQKANAEEMARMLSALFETEGGRSDSLMGQGDKGGMPPIFGQEPIQGLKVVLLKHPGQSLFLVGSKDLIDKACKIIEDVESTIGDVQERSIYWYACRHSEAEELAKVLSQVYGRLIGLSQPAAKNPLPSSIRVIEQKIKSPAEPAQPGTIVTPPPLIAPSTQEKQKSGSLNENFIVDPKTNSIVMVVENYVLPKLKELVHKLDVPKQMVQIDVLLFEKRIGDSSSFGMNLLRMGHAASKKHRESLVWNNHDRGDKHHHKKRHKHRDNEDDELDDDSVDFAHHLPEFGRGILEYAISRGKNGFLPFDLVFQFLLTQENIQINANPSVTTVNQTPAKIAVVDQISINTGAVPFGHDKVENAYTRAEYGITIQITPTIHAKVDDDEHSSNEPKFITLATDLIFDTTRPGEHDRPSVTRRNVKNEVRVADGETVIIGGLRRKTQDGTQESVPFLGELPGIGKLFSTTALTSHSTEMFVFITPRIVPDTQEEMRKLRREDLLKRPGDTPDFLREVEEARLKEKRKLFERSLEMLFKTPDQIQ